MSQLLSDPEENQRMLAVINFTLLKFVSCDRSRDVRLNTTAFLLSVYSQLLRVHTEWG